MKALYFDGQLSLRDLPQPVPLSGEALIRVLCAGICATDREIVKGYMDFRGIPGHEFVGVVEACEDASWIGKRVVGEINAACGQCEMCQQGLRRHCPHRTVLGIQGRDGAFAQYLTLPVENLYEVPAGIDDLTAVFTEPLSAAREILEQVKIEPSCKTLIIGDGKLSALIAQVLKLHAVNLTVLGKSPRKLEIFSRWGIETTREKPALSSCDLVIEASGNPEGWGIAMEAVKPRGTIMLKSTYRGEFNFNPALLVINEITLVGSRCGKFPPALRLLEQGLIDVKSLISAVYNFSDILSAFEFSLEPECMKMIVKF